MRLILTRIADDSFDGPGLTFNQYMLVVMLAELVKSYQTLVNALIEPFIDNRIAIKYIIDRFITNATRDSLISDAVKQLVSVIAGTCNPKVKVFFVIFFICTFFICTYESKYLIFFIYKTVFSPNN